MPNKLLILLTSMYPYGSGETFLETEIQYLAQAFHQVIVVPRQQPSLSARSMPENVHLDLGLVALMGTPTRWGKLKSRLFLLPEMARCGCLMPELRSARRRILAPKSIQNLAASLHSAIMTYRWARDFLARSASQSALFYTYWMSGQTFGVALLKHQHPPLTLISRTHGGDLYWEVHSPPYIPLQAQSLEQLDRVFCISQQGAAYLSQRYPQQRSKILVSPLGVRDPQANAAFSTDDVLRVVTCSSLTAVKRLDRWIDALSLIAKHYPKQAIEWTHFGDGPLRKALEAQATSLKSTRIIVQWMGQRTNQKVLDHYRCHYVDLFVNVSQSEGLPVSIMEAQSYGIPVMAPAVGGIPEAVNAENGYLLSATPTATEIVRALEHFIAMPVDERQAKRQQSRFTWSKDYDAERNYRTFTQQLVEI